MQAEIQLKELNSINLRFFQTMSNSLNIGEDGMNEIIYEQSVTAKELCSLDYQRMCIGTEIVTQMVNYIKENAFEHAHTAIGLMSARGKEDFYLKLGFRLRPNDKEGHGRCIV